VSASRAWRACVAGLASTLAVAAPASAAGPRVHAAGTRAPGVETGLTVSGARPEAPVVLERSTGHGWRAVADGRSDAAGRLTTRVTTPLRAGRWPLRARETGGPVGPTFRMRIRPVTLDAVGDVNLGDGPGDVMRLRGPRWPWLRVGRALHGADLAFANLECAVSTRGAPVPKTYHFRSPPRRLRAMRRVAGIDVVNLANNHIGDFGAVATGDTVRNVAQAGLVGVGAGLDVAGAARPRIVRRLGLRIAFVGFSDIPPFSFGAGANRAGTRIATAANVRHDVRIARRRADVVIASLHWGIEYDPHPPTARQRALARAALRAGAVAVIGAHPHVLQPIARPGRHRIVAYSLGNFVFAPRNARAARTGVLELRLSSRGVEHAHLRRARIVGVQPRFVS
jgi:poly-gamma-glutamate synthesis protein (capsule biosynthesis protein)